MIYLMVFVSCFFGVYFGVRTCELFLCFAPFVFLGFIVLTLFCLFSITCNCFAGFYTEDEPVLLEE